MVKNGWMLLNNPIQTWDGGGGGGELNQFPLLHFLLLLFNGKR